jgi:DNA-binding MarR family transcriptional regulator
MGSSKGRREIDVDPTARLLGMVAARVSRLHRERLARPDVGLTYRQYRTLVRVSDGCTSLSERAALANLTTATVSEGVDVLVRRGLLSRERRTDDRRAFTLTLTPKGKKTLAAGDRAFHEIADAIIKEIPDSDREFLTKTIETIYEAATTLFRETFGSGSPGVD